MMQMSRTVCAAQKMAQAKIGRHTYSKFLPYKVTITPTHSCNCRCKLCGIWRLPKKGAELSVEEYSAIFKNLGGDLTWLNVSGGEPFMRKDLAQILETAAAKCKNLCLISINTNGIESKRITSVLDRLLKMPGNMRIYLAVSLDGPREIHNLMRGRNNAFDRARRTLRELERLKRNHKNLHVETETLVCKLNADHLPSIGGWPDRHFTFATKSGHYNNAGACDCLIEDADQVMEISGKIARGVELNSAFSITKKIFFKITSRHARSVGRRQILPCHASWSSVWIDPWGIVRPCIMFDAELGHLRESAYDLSGILVGKRTREVRRLIKGEKCANCWTPCEASVSIMQSPFLSLLRCLG